MTKDKYVISTVGEENERCRSNYKINDKSDIDEPYLYGSLSEVYEIFEKARYEKEGFVPATDLLGL